MQRFCVSEDITVRHEGRDEWQRKVDVIAAVIEKKLVKEAGN